VSAAWGAPPEAPDATLLVVDLDDDDDDGVSDVSTRRLGPRALERLAWLDAVELPPDWRVPDTGVLRFISARGTPLEPGTAAPGGRVGVQARAPGRAVLRLNSGERMFSAVELRALDAQGRPVDPARSHASLSRVLPRELAPEVADEDELSWLVLGPEGALPSELPIESFAATGRLLDRAGPLPLASFPCPEDAPEGVACRLSWPLRASTDPVDREHPAAAARSVLAEVGGRIRAKVGQTAPARGHAGRQVPGQGISLRVGGPRGAAGHEFGRYRAVVRTRIVRASPGSPAVGADDGAARAFLRGELALASALWGQCGIHFGLPEELDIQVVDAPPPHLFAVGCGAAQPASGGRVRVLVRGRVVEIETSPGEAPGSVASRLAAAIESQGADVRARVTMNAPVPRSALRSADVLVRDAKGGFVPLGTPGGAPASSDPSLPVCLGTVELGDGLEHFNDFDAGAGTLEERTLIKGLEDGDPTTIELLVVPSFGGSGRIGESFISGPGASLESAVLLDRAALRSGARSFTLAHELGHVLLDMPGHPDDFGVDTPSALMDADASDPSIFGPRRLSRADCERALRQSGPEAPAPLLRPWPLFRESRER
jgi:hypothetical protein